MKISRFIAKVPTDRGRIIDMDGIAYEGTLWLVPKWFDLPEKGMITPVRRIRLDLLPHQVSPPGGDHQFVVTGPIPEDVLYGPTPPEEAHGFVVETEPRIAIRGGTGIQ